MTAISLAKAAYSGTNQAVQSPRGTEYALFSQVTQRLKDAIANKETNYSALVAAVHQNRLLWTRMAGSVADSDNALPQELRARLFFLAEFTDRHSRAVLSSNVDASVLVDINRAIMAGLRPAKAAA